MQSLAVGLIVLPTLAAAFSGVVPPASVVAARTTAPSMLSHRHNRDVLRMVVSRDDANLHVEDQEAHNPVQEQALESVPGNAYFTDKPSDDPLVTCYMSPESEEDEKPRWVCTERGALGNAGDADDTY
jgi:hypothetical protein